MTVTELHRLHVKSFDSSRHSFTNYSEVPALQFQHTIVPALLFHTITCFVRKFVEQILIKMFHLHLIQSFATALIFDLAAKLHYPDSILFSKSANCTLLVINLDSYCTIRQKKWNPSTSF